MLNIYLARHGQDQDNANGILNGRRDMPLTELGVNQAKELAGKLKLIGIKFEKVFSSLLMVTIIFESHSTTLDNQAHLSSGHYDVE